MVLAYVEADPHIVHQRHVHDGSTRTNEFAHLREYLSHFAVGRSSKYRFADIRIYFLHGSLCTIYLSGSGFLILALSTIFSHVVLRLGGTFGGNGGIALCCHFVEFLGGHHALVKQSLHAVVRFFGNAHAGTCFLPHFVSCSNLFLARTAFSFAVQCGSGRFGGACLRKFSLNIGGFEYGQRVAGMYILSFFHHVAQHATGHFARHAIFRDVGLSLNGIGFFFKGIHTADNYQYNDAGQNENGGQKIRFLT